MSHEQELEHTVSTGVENKNSESEEDEVDLLTDQFSGVLQTLATFRTQITSLQQQVRGLEKTVKKEQKVLRKEATKNRQKGNRKPSGFARPTKISDALCVFMGRDKGTEVARTEVTQYIIAYIKDQNLQNSANRKIILPNEPLRDLLGVGDDDEVTYFNIQKYMNQHFHKRQNKEENVVVETVL